MKRRQLLYGLGGLTGASSLTLGTGAFTSVEASRSVSVAVADDADAFLRLAPCDGPNGDYVTTGGGTVALDVSASNDALLGAGVNADALTVVDDVLEVENQGTQPVGVWLDPPEPVDDANGDPAVEFYRGGDPDAGVVGESDAVCLGVGEAVCVGFLTRTHGLSPGDALFESGSAGDLVVNADAAVACGGTPPSTPRRLSTGVADWRVTGVPDEKSAGATTPRDATVVTPPSAWVTSTADAAWVDPFGDGGTTSDPEGTYEYELAFDGPGALVVEEYASDNPVEFSLDGTPIGGTDDPRAYRTLRSNVPAQSVGAGTHTLRAVVENAPASSDNPTGLLVAARLE
jgi:hypothetical protein